MHFTDKSIMALKPKDKPYVVTADSDARGVGRLQLKIYPTGSKKFQFQYYSDGRRRRTEIGPYGALSLADARKKFLVLSELVQRGGNPADDKAKVKVEKEKAEAQRSLLEMIEDFTVFIKKNWADTTIKRTVNILKSDVKPYITEDMQPQDFTTDFARELIYRVYNRGAKQQAGAVRSDLMSMCKFAIDFDNSPEQFKNENRYGLSNNPIRDIVFEIPKNAGQRWLTTDELYKVWYADDLPKMSQLYFKAALALGGQRVCELYYSKLSEFDFDSNIFTIPKERIKIRKRGDHLVPISPLAKGLITELALMRNKAGHLWPHRDDVNEHASLSTLRMSLQRWCKKHKMPIFAPRDFRRTCKTLMGAAGISKEMRDILQQHDKSDVSVIHYDRYNYINEKREAMDIWTAFLVKKVITRKIKDKEVT
jgi:integrase